MKFRVTEDTFFLQAERKSGDILEAPVGPYRNVAGAGGLSRIPQFVEIKEDIAMADAVSTAANQTATAGPTAAMLPANAMPAKAEPIRKTITGASALGSDFKARIAAARAKVAAAQGQIGTSIANVDSAAERAVAVAAAIQAEADDLNASIGQVSNE